MQPFTLIAYYSGWPYSAIRGAYWELRKSHPFSGTTNVFLIFHLKQTISFSKKMGCKWKSELSHTKQRTELFYRRKAKKEKEKKVAEGRLRWLSLHLFIKKDETKLQSLFSSSCAVVILLFRLRKSPNKQRDHFLLTMTTSSSFLR